MADTKEKEPKADTKEKEPKPAQPVAAGDPGATPRVKEKKEKKAKKPADVQQAPAAEPEGPPAEPAPRPRLLDYYEQRVRSKLAQQFGLENPHRIPRLLKIVLNVGMGDAIKNPKGLEAAGGARRHLRPATGGDEGQEVDRELQPPARDGGGLQ